MMTRELNDIRSALDVVANILEGLQSRLDALTVPHAPSDTLKEQFEEFYAYHARHCDAVTRDVPEGYDTILGFLAKHHPDVLDTFDYRDPSATVRDGYKLRHMTRETRGSVLYVEAPSCLRAAGIDKVRAYPVALLQQRWG